MPILEARDITKLFPGVTALKSVSIAFEPGRIHCVIGENGAGKSTLIKCLTGVYQPESGHIFIEGREVGGEGREAFKKIAYVPQEIDLFNHMSVAENLFLPYDGPEFKGLLNQGRLEKMAEPVLARFRIKVRPDELVKNVSISAQQLIQIARATVSGAYGALMLDEPTTSLTTGDTEILFDIIREIRADGRAVIFISHKLEEIFELGDEITIMRNGEKVYHAPIRDIDIPGVVTRMTGRALDRDESFQSTEVSDGALLEVDTLTGEKFTEVSFQLRPGEILGFYGLVGAGRTELMQAIFGYLPVYAGGVRVAGEPWKLGDTNYSVRNGLIYLPEERKKYGILPMLSIRENISISVLDFLRGLAGISPAKENEVAEQVITAYDVKTPDAEKAIQFLSGGNQQKVIIGRAMVSRPRILIFDEPTKGIDVGAKTEIYRMMKRVAEEHRLGIILISSEMEEVQKCSNRVIVMYEGRKAGEFPAGANREDILSAVIGISGTGKETDPHGT